MTHKVILLPALAAGLLAFAPPAPAAPLAPIKTTPASVLQEVTFWGEPFPYGYNWDRTRACTQYETVDTGRGLVTRRVWVCGQEKPPVVSYRN